MQAINQSPKKVYEQKKHIFRLNQIVWYVLGIIEVALAFRVALKALGANPAQFTSFVYMITNPLAQPFRGIFGLTQVGRAQMEWTTILAMVVYFIVAWGLVYLFDLINPITVEEIDSAV